MREESRIFVAHGDINSYDYQMAVYLTTVSENEWMQLQPTERDLQRFRRRRRLGWTGTDSMYDAWLLIEDTRREDFDMELFTTRFPNWQSLLQKQVGNNRKSILVERKQSDHENSGDDDDDDDDEDEDDDDEDEDEDEDDDDEDEDEDSDDGMASRRMSMQRKKAKRIKYSSEDE